MRDIFDRIKMDRFDNTIIDRFDEVKIDAFDQVDLPPEEKILYSEELHALIRSSIQEAIKKIQIADIVTSFIQKESDKQKKTDADLEEELSEEIEKIGDKNGEAIEDLKKDIDKRLDGMDKKNSDLSNVLFSQPWYQFGGFSPQMNDLIIGPNNTEGSWRIVISGSDLSVDRFESGNWVRKGAFNP